MPPCIIDMQPGYILSPLVFELLKLLLLTFISEQGTVCLYPILGKASLRLYILPI